MPRIVTITAALTALLAGVASARPSDIPSPDLSLARLVSCDMSGPDRSAVFYGRLVALPGAGRLAIKFTLLEQLGRGADWTKIDLPDLRQWRRSVAGVKTFGYRQTVDNLHAGGAYKARVQYRWLAADGTPLDTLTRDTGVCRGLLPNLAAGDLEVLPGPTPETRTYRVTVLNDGKGDADAVDVALNVDHAVLDTTTIDRLDAGTSRTVTFAGPPCIHAVRVRIDPDNTIGESSEGDNARLFSCP
jgi:hypothetical protein